MHEVEILHINCPESKSDKFRILPKYCRKFIEKDFLTLKRALEYGLIYTTQGFRVFRQKTFEWYDPLNTEVAKIAEKKKWENK